MFRRLPLGFAGVVAAAIAIAACSSPNATQAIAVGPNFPSQTLYAANVTQNAVSIYSPGPKSTTGPLYEIGGSNTTIAGPQYLAFDSQSDLWVTNWLSSTGDGGILEFKALATGNVLPFQSFSLGTVRPRGIVDYLYTFSGQTTAVDILAVAITDPSQPTAFNSGLEFYVASLLSTPFQTLAGPATGLNVPSGLAVDSKNNIYAANLQGASVTEYTLPSASPTSSPTPTPTASPTPAPTPTGATASPSPTPVPTPTPVNIAPVATISGAASGINQPTSVAIDSNNYIYVSDQSSSICSPKPNCPAILIFKPGANGAVAPAQYIAGSNTRLVAPTDVKVDKAGNIYVADEAAGAGVIYVFASTANGNVAPMATLNSPGAVIGLGLAP
ncbi:MAG TPA: hypothetical protein VMB20_03060 [Candidatus Acidoferrum sp.]|nr:hypothetical protein [Candidatus Acidoferrum sp.]